MNILNKLLELENKVATDLRLQYKAFRICFWTMMGIATVIVATSDNYSFACIVALLGLMSGSLANQKSVLLYLKDIEDNQEQVMQNQMLIALDVKELKLHNNTNLLKDLIEVKRMLDVKVSGFESKKD